jgi:hypothetical protein
MADEAVAEEAGGGDGRGEDDVVTVLRGVCDGDRGGGRDIDGGSASGWVACEEVEVADVDRRPMPEDACCRAAGA